MKKRKITIKPFLNTLLEPETLTDEKGSREVYPLYYKVTYDRRNTQLKSAYAPMGYYNLNDPSAKEIIDFEIKILTKLIDYETSLNPDKEYQLTGLKIRFECYSQSIDYTIDKFLREKLFKTVQKTNHLYQYALKFDNYLGRMNVFTLLEICDKLFPDFDKYIDKTFREELECFKLYHKIFGDKTYHYNFSTLIDWMTGEHQKKLSEELKKTLKADSKSTTHSIAIINNIVLERLKNIALD